MPLTVRLDPDTTRRLDRVAARQGSTRSELVRRALDRYLDAEEAPRSFYDEFRDSVGCADSGGQNLSEDTGRKLHELLQARRAARTD